MISDLRVGDCIEHNGKPMIIQNVSSNQVGRGSRSFVLGIKDPSTSAQTTLKPSAKESFEKVDLRDKPVTLLYNDDTELVGMDPKSLEQVTVPLTLLTSPTQSNSVVPAKSLLPYLESGTELRVRYWGEVPVSVIPPRIVKCTVKGILFVQESMEQKKLTVLTLNGARVVVPVKVEPEDVIMVNLEDGSYNSKL